MSHVSEKSASDEAELLALMKRDGAVLRARALEDEAQPVPAKRKPFSAEARANIARAMRGNSNRKKSQPAIVSPIANRRAGHG